MHCQSMLVHLGGLPFLILHGSAPLKTLLGLDNILKKNDQLKVVIASNILCSLFIKTSFFSFKNILLRYVIYFSSATIKMI